MESFWKNLPIPFFALAPMHEITDEAFRQMIIKCGRPHVFFTEFVSSDGLCSPGKEKLMHNLLFHVQERPIVGQIFGADPEKMAKAAGIIKDSGFDGVDLNFGCPDQNIVNQGGCSALIKNPELAKKIVLAVKRQVGEYPVSIKTRLGYSQLSEFEGWFSALLETKPDAITIHARTKKEMYRPGAHWEYVSKAVEMAKGSRVVIIGNGDVVSLEEGKHRASETSCQGIMIGRAVLNNPWVFNERVDVSKIKLEERKKLLLEHLELHEKYFDGIKSYANMKKFFRTYISEFEGAKELRMKLMEAKDAEELRKLIS